MPTVKLSHEGNRVKVCAVCYGRSGSKAKQRVTERLELGIKRFVYAEYAVSDERFPSGICTTCYFSLSENIKGSSLGDRDTPKKLLLPDPGRSQIISDPFLRISDLNLTTFRSNI